METYKLESLRIGFNLPFDLTRIAREAGRLKTNQLMTHKGSPAGICLENLTSMLNQPNPGFNFTGRKNKSNSRNYNASDEINTLLNYGYAVLESEIREYQLS